MRLFLEILLFVAIMVLAVLAGALVLWIAGVPLALDFGKSLVFSFVGLFFVFPGAMNIWILFRGSGGEHTGERWGAGIRGFGMLVCAVAVAIPALVPAAGAGEAVWIFVIGNIFWWGSIPFDSHFSRLRAKAATLPEVKDRESHGGSR